MNILEGIGPVNTSDALGMKRIIHNNDSAIYTGKAYDDEGRKIEIALEVDKGKGATLYIEQPKKRRWNEVIYFNSEGRREGEGVKPAIV